MTAIILIAAICFAYGLYLLRQSDLVRLRHYEEHAKAFHAAARPLIQDDETPEAVLDILDALNSKVSDKWAAFSFLMFLTSGPPSPETKPRIATIRAFFKTRPELEAQYVKALVSALLAMSYLGRISGKKLRLWLTTIETPEKQEEIGVNFSVYNGAIAA